MDKIILAVAMLAVLALAGILGGCANSSPPTDKQMFDAYVDNIKISGVDNGVYYLELERGVRIIGPINNERVFAVKLSQFKKNILI